MRFLPSGKSGGTDVRPQTTSTALAPRVNQQALSRAGGALAPPTPTPSGPTRGDLLQLRRELSTLDPQDPGKALAREAVPLGVNYVLSAANSTVFGRAVQQVTRLKPSTWALVAGAVVAFFSPRRWRRAKGAAVKVVKGAGHAVLSDLGRQSGEALSGEQPAGTSGYAPEGETPQSQEPTEDGAQPTET